MSSIAVLRKKKSVSVQHKRKIDFTPYLLILPAYALFIVFFLVPTFQSFLYTFYHWNGFSPHKAFAGLSNYAQLLHDSAFWNALRVTVFYTLGVVPTSMIVGLFFALLMSKKIPGVGFFRSVYFLPTIMSAVSVSVVWTWIYNGGQFGVANQVLRFLGMKPIDWLNDPHFALLALIIVGIWQNVGYCLVIFLAGLKSIPVMVYEASSVDGAGAWTKLIHITLPLLLPTVSFLVITLSIHSFEVFDQVNVMTGGGPAGSTDVLVTYLYRVGFGEFHMGYASTVAFVLFVMIAIVSIIQRKFLERSV